MRVYEAVIEYLVRAGVTRFAGLVGSTTAPYFYELRQRDDVRYLPVRHEQVAAAAMDASARLTGVPGCLLTHGASGALAASLGVASAAGDSTPLLALTATQERIAMERGYWQTASVVDPLASMTTWGERVERPDQALEALRSALRSCVAGGNGVSQVDIPIDVSRAEFDGVEIWPEGDVRAPGHRPCAAPDALADVHRLLAAAHRPVILIGGGARYSGAGENIIRLGEAIGAPIVCSATSRGVVPETHELVMGCSGILGYEPVGDVVMQADLILAIGSRMSDLQLDRGRLVADGVHVVQVNIDDGAIGRYHPVEVGIVADADEFASQLCDFLAAEPLDGREERRKWIVDSGDSVRKWFQEWLRSGRGNGLVQPQEVVGELARRLPSDTILTHGAGDHMFYGMMVPVAAPGAHIVSARLGAMGCGLGYAAGAKIARPDQLVVACLGDGEFALQLADLETLARERLNVVVVVFNNFRFGSQRARVNSYGPAAVLGPDHGNPDFAAYAELCGCMGVRVDTPNSFGAALQKALESDVPALIDVIVDPDARPPRGELPAHGIRVDAGKSS